MIDDSILTKINKMKRKKLMSFISDHDRDGGARLFDASTHYLTTPREDTGTVILFMITKSKYTERNSDFFVLMDTIDKVGTETFKHSSHRPEQLKDFLGIEPPKKGGRPRRILTDEEKERIRELREQGRGYNAIAKELKVSNRIVIECCK